MSPLVGWRQTRDKKNRIKEHISMDQSHHGPKTKIILDTDPAGYIWTGLDVDDDLTILNILSLHFVNKPSIELLGITVTGGNAPIQYTYPNILHLVRYMAGMSEDEIGIYRGGPPLATILPYPINQNDDVAKISSGISSEATTYLIDTIMNTKEKDPITVLCIGPLTNIAAAFLLEPRIVDRIGRIVTMGGTLTPGLAYDLNLRTDPVAAAIVWNDMDCKKIIIPIETCIQATFGPPQLQKVHDQCSLQQQQQHRTDFLPSSPRSSSSFPNTSPIVCSLLIRMRIQQIVMPWLVNWRFIRGDDDFTPAPPNGGATTATTTTLITTTSKNLQSDHVGDGFMLWDLVALWAVVRPDLFDDWTYFRATVIPYDDTNLFGRRTGLKIEWSHLTRYGPHESHSDHRNLVLVPLKLKHEHELVDLILNNLWLPTMASDNVFDDRRLSFRNQLGSLPDFLTTVIVLVLGLLIMIRNLRAVR